MRVRKLSERRVFGQAGGEALQPLSTEQVEQVGGGFYYYNDQVAPEPAPPIFYESPSGPG
jgi:hypothetical protein